MTLTSRYQNCFYYFRGPSVKSKELAIDRQLEDNSTKALINVLEHGGPDLCGSFLSRLLGISIESWDLKPEYFLQGGPSAPANRRLLVGLSQQGEIDPGSWSDKPESPVGSRIDGTVHLPGQITVLLETKVVDLLDGAQMQRHAKEWGVPLAEPSELDAGLPDEWLLITWADVDRWAREAAEMPLPPVPAFLIRQLIEFLGHAALAPTWVLGPEHFDFFRPDLDARDPAVKSEIRRRLASIWGRIEESMGNERYRKSLGEIRVGNIGGKDDHAWAQSHADDSKSGPHLPNLTVELNHEEASVNLVGWFDDQLARVREWLTSDSGSRFIAAAPEYELLIFKRLGPVWQNAKGVLVDRIRFRDSSPANLEAKITGLADTLDPNREKPSIHVRRAWPRDDAIGQDSLAEKMALEVERLVPELERIRPRLRPRPERVPVTPSKLDRFRGCLLGGAIGDALGEPIEFMGLNEIRSRFGPEGLADYPDPVGRITDDTQMTLYTAEGLLRAHVRAEERGICSPPSVVYHAYVRWLDTQAETSKSVFFKPDEFDGRLAQVDELRSRRVPGNTCISALRGEERGSVEEPLNDSKGCGGVMRIAPVGLSSVNNPFETACEIAALTHGHPSGYLAAGFLAVAIRSIAESDMSLESAIDVAREELIGWDGHDECLVAVDEAIAMASDRDLSPSRISLLGEGWVAEEALAIGLYCALVAEDFAEGVLLAVNHDGDSDSTGSIAGSILGAHRGVEAIPKAWIERLELRNLIDEMATDLHSFGTEGFDVVREWEKYPGW